MLCERSNFRPLWGAGQLETSFDVFDFETQTVLLAVGSRRKTEWLVVRMDKAEVIHLRQGFERGCGFVWGFDAGTALSVCGLIGV